MKIICISEEIGIVWYTALDYKRQEIHVVVYGLQVKQFNNRADAQTLDEIAQELFVECCESEMVELALNNADDIAGKVTGLQNLRSVS